LDDPRFAEWGEKGVVEKTVICFGILKIRKGDDPAFQICSVVHLRTINNDRGDRVFFLYKHFISILLAHGQTPFFNSVISTYYWEISTHYHLIEHRSIWVYIKAEK